MTHKSYTISPGLARRIRVRMAELDIPSQTELGRRIGVRASYINDILHGRRYGEARRKQLAALLDIPESELLPQAPEPAPTEEPAACSLPS